MKKMGLFLVPGFVLALALTAAAQEKPVTTTKEMDQTVKMTVSGRVVLDYVWRSQEVTGFTTGYSSLSPTNSSDSENTFEGYMAIRLDVELTDKISAVVEIGTLRVDDGSINTWGNSFSNFLQLREAHLMIAELFAPEIKAQLGLTTWSFDVRGRGSSFAFDPRHSSSITKNVSNVADGVGTQGITLLDRANNPDEMMTMGVVATWSRENITLDLVILPAVEESGNPSEDEALYAVDFWYRLDNVGKGSRVGAIFAISTFGDNISNGTTDTDTSIYTLGGGVVLKGIGAEGLEIYAEIYFQFGNAGQFDPPGAPPEEDLDAAGRAFQVGAEYQLAGDVRPWVGINITWISGDDDDITSLDDDTVGNFLSYENINDLLILEDMYFGFDWDSNYLAFKFMGGVALSVGSGKNNLELSAILGIARTVEDVEFASGGEDKLGNEFDARAKLILTKQFSINAAIGFLFGSDVLEQSMRAGGAVDDEDSAMIYTLGMDVRY